MQVGDAKEDHDFWGRPEEMNMRRPAYAVNRNSPGSEVSAETAAAFAAGSIAFRTEGNQSSLPVVNETSLDGVCGGGGGGEGGGSSDRSFMDPSWTH